MFDVESYSRMDELAEKAGGYVVPPTEEDIAYANLWFDICKQFGVRYASATEKERFFVDAVTQIAWARKQEQADGVRILEFNEDELPEDSRATFYKTLERMCQSGELCEVSKGIYCRPQKGKYGIVPPSEAEIVSAFTVNGTGVVVGYALYNALNLTTQIPKTTTVLSSAIESDAKTIGNIVIKRCELEFTEPVKNMISALEVFQNFREIEDLNRISFRSFTKTFAENFSDEVFENVCGKIKYPASTITFALKVLQHYRIPNRLRNYIPSSKEG